MALPLSGILAQHFGWEWIFYVFGVLGLLWCISWTWVRSRFLIFNIQNSNFYKQAFALLNFYCNKSAIIAINAIIAIIQ